MSKHWLLKTINRKRKNGTSCVCIQQPVLFSVHLPRRHFTLCFVLISVNIVSSVNSAICHSQAKQTQGGTRKKKEKNMKLMSHCVLFSLQKKTNNAVIYLTCTGGFSVATSILLVCKIFLMWIRTAYIKLQISHNYYGVSKSTVLDLYYRPPKKFCVHAVDTNWDRIIFCFSRYVRPGYILLSSPMQFSLFIAASDFYVPGWVEPAVNHLPLSLTYCIEASLTIDATSSWMSLNSLRAPTIHLWPNSSV